MSFLRKILGRDEPVAPKTNEPHEEELIGKLDCGDGKTLVIRGFNSTLGINGRNAYIRRYHIILELEGQSREQVAEFVKQHGGNEKSLLPDNTIHLSTIPGEAWIAINDSQALSKNYQKLANIDADKVTKIILDDTERHPGLFETKSPITPSAIGGDRNTSSGGRNT